ncbi:hypothetical protein [Komagataeibacter xylinus]|uniref:hypothetical protein n=1 Tax=Komagataeibacter xylinus TaxID=28448 RepID=UPI0013EE404F|nr:hypothetical protein [Komagataeibacter xylinus]
MVIWSVPFRGAAGRAAQKAGCAVMPHPAAGIARVVASRVPGTPPAMRSKR